MRCLYLTVELPRIDDMYTAVRGDRIFSVDGFSSGYHQVRLPEDDVLLTSFRTPLGLVAFKVLPFGLRNAPQNVSSCDEQCSAAPERFLPRVYGRRPGVL